MTLREFTAAAAVAAAALAPAALGATASTILPTPADVAAPAGGVGVPQAINLGAAPPGVTYEVAVPPRNGVVQDAVPTDPALLYTPNPGSRERTRSGTGCARRRS